MKRSTFRLALLGLFAWSIISVTAETKDTAIRTSPERMPPAATASRDPGGVGHRFTLTNGVTRVPVVVVRGTPEQMGWRLGRLMQEEIQQLVPARSPVSRRSWV